MISLVLRGWVGLVGVIALVNGALCYKKPETVQRQLFNQHPRGEIFILFYSYTFILITF